MIESTLVKMSKLPQILESAKFLHSLGILEESPEHYVRRYVEENPEINEYLNAPSTSTS